MSGLCGRQTDGRWCSKRGGRSAAPAPQLQAESSRARPAGAPWPPQVLRSHQRLVCRWQLLHAAERRAVLSSGGSCGQPQHSDEPLLRR